MKSPSFSTRRDFMLTTAAGLAAAPALLGAEADKPRIKIGQLGTKHAHASGKLKSILKFPEIYDFVGIVEPDPKRREYAQGSDSFGADLNWITEEELLGTEGLQVVAVETEVNELVPSAVRCLEAGMHIHLDKPAGESLEACKAMHKVANERGLTIQMGYMLRYNPAFQFLYDILEKGWLGEITEITCMMGKYMDDGGRKKLAEFEGGGMFELACHIIDQVVYILGAPDKVTAHIRRTFPEKDTFADNQLAVFDYPKALATVRCNHIDPMGGARRQFCVTGTQGTFEIRPLEPARGRLGLDRERGEFKKGFQDVEFERTSGRYDGEFLDLAKIVRGEKKLAWNSAHDIAVEEAVLRASGMM